MFTVGETFDDVFDLKILENAFVFMKQDLKQSRKVRMCSVHILSEFWMLLNLELGTTVVVFSAYISIICAYAVLYCAYVRFQKVQCNFSVLEILLNADSIAV